MDKEKVLLGELINKGQVWSMAWGGVWGGAHKTYLTTSSLHPSELGWDEVSLQAAEDGAGPGVQ